MLDRLRKNLFGSSADRAREALLQKADVVVAALPELAGVSDEDLVRMGALLREQRPADRVQALAIGCEAARRSLGLTPYPVQVAGALVLLDGRIAEMQTGEGKTLVAALASFVAALEGQVHVVTVNDYLARRDAENVGRLHRFMGMTVGCIVSGLTEDETRDAYACDVVYATATQIGFDHLKDGLATSRDAILQPERRFAIVDEVDSVLIDEARTPLIISFPDTRTAGDVSRIAELVSSMDGASFSHDERNGTAVLTDAGEAVLEERLLEARLIDPGTTLFDPRNIVVAHRVNQAVNARFLLLRDRNYALIDGRVAIIDQGTGRVMEGRNFADGLHQAVEAKEGVEQTPETTTLASVSIQNLFRGYATLSGMTGTAMSDARELMDIYGLEVVPVPTNRPSCRVAEADEIYRTEREKIAAVVREITSANDRMQPVLVGTPSVEKSRALADALVASGFTEIEGTEDALRSFSDAARRGVPGRTFCVLNALNHGMEARIVAEAGVPGAVVVATAMAGRGTDIRLGGEPSGSRSADETLRFRIEAERAGGLYVVGTERAENRRIDDQLRGRAGRQGEPGRTKFFLSLEDHLLRVFGGIGTLAEVADLKEGQAISHRMVDRIVRDAQVRIEKRNFDVRADLVRFDDVIEIQRREVAKLRFSILDAVEFDEWVGEIRSDVATSVVARHSNRSDHSDGWDYEGMSEELARILPFRVPVADLCRGRDDVDQARFASAVGDIASRMRAQALEGVPPEEAIEATRKLMLAVLDAVWRDHMTVLERMRKEATFSHLGGRDPIVEFRTQAGEALGAMLDQWKWYLFRELHVPRGPATVEFGRRG